MVPQEIAVSQSGFPVSAVETTFKRRYRPCWAVLAVLVAVAPVYAQDLGFRDLRELGDGTIPTRAPLGAAPVVSEFGSTPDDVLPRNAPDASLSAPIARLALNAKGLLNVGATPAGAPVVLASPRVEFQVAGIDVSMALIEPVVDVGFDAVHLTLVAPSPSGARNGEPVRDHARFTISRSGPEVLGTLFIGGNEYRVLPDGEGHQLVYPVRLYAGDFRTVRVLDSAQRVDRLEARHLQLAWIAEKQPQRFATGSDGRLLDYRATGAARSGPALGTVDIWRGLRTDGGRLQADSPLLAEAIEEFLREVVHLTLVTDPLEVAIQRANLAALYSQTSDRATILFNQVMDGVRVEDSMSIEVDGGGRVWEFRGPLVKSDMADRREGFIIDAGQAEQIGRSRAVAQFEIDWPIDAGSIDLAWRRTRDGAGVTRLWRVQFGAPCLLMYVVTVDAISGEAVSAVEMEAAMSIMPTREALRQRCREAALSSGR